MNPAEQHAAESLAVDLAKGLVSIDSMELTESQKTLQISPHLVYLCGLVVNNADDEQSTTTKSFTKDQIDLFQHLQRIYQEAKEEECVSSYYHWSPTLLPCGTAQRIIQADRKQRQEELAQAASEAAQKLLLLEEEEEAKNKPKKASVVGRTKPLRSTVNADKEEVIVHDEMKDQQENESPETTSLEDLMKPVLLRTVNENDLCSGDWTEVRTTKKNAKNKDRNESELSKAVSHQVAEEVEILKNAKEEEEEEDVEQETQMPVSPLNVNEIEEQPAQMDEASNDNELSLLRARLQQLELELTSKEELLEQERQTHRKALKAQQESWDERMQALQLRLYISETRLKTYEDALDQHVEAVANNVATGISPARRIQDERPLSSSRVLGNQQV